MSLKMKTRRKNERGVAMLIALLSLVLLAIIGLGFMFMADTENSVNNNYKDAEKAYFASRAGLENVRLLLTPPNPGAGIAAGPLYNQVSNLTMPNAAANTGVIYVENPTGAGDVIDPTSGLTGTADTPTLNPTLDDELCHEQFGLLALVSPGAGAPCLGAGQVMKQTPNYYQVPTPALPANAIVNTGTPGALPFKWVRITNKQNFMGLAGQSVAPPPALPGDQVCWDGQQETVAAPGACGPNANPVWLLTSLAVTPGAGANAGSRRFTQMEVAITPPLYPPGTISTQAPVNLHGSYSLQSYDNCSCKQTTVNGNTVWVPRSAGATCNQNAHVIYTGGSISTQGSSGVVLSNYGNSANSASVQNVNPWPFDVNKLINQYKNGAINASTTAPYNYSCTGTPNFTATPPVYASCGLQTSQGFGGFPPGLPDNNAFPTGTGPQTTYIPGSVKLTSDANGSGILIVDGDLEINGGFNFYGLVLVRGQVSFSGGGSNNVNLYGSILAGQDVLANDTSMTDSFGGSINFKYDRCALALSAPTGPPNLIATHELMY